MTVAEQRDHARTIANHRRHRLSTLKRDLHTDTLPLATIMQDPPADLAGVPLIDLIRWARYGRTSPTYSSGTGLEAVGRGAVLAGVNLLVPLGRASARSRAWVAANGLHRSRTIRQETQAA